MNDALGFIGLQAWVILGLAMGIKGICQIQESDPFQDDERTNGWLFVIAGVLSVLIFGFLIQVAGWAVFGLGVGLPVLVSIPIYWLYRSQKESRVFIWIGVAQWPGMAAFFMSISSVLSSESLLSYWVLGGSILASGFVVYVYRKLIIRKQSLPPHELQRAANDPWGTIGAAIGISIGGAILRVVVGKLPAEGQNAFDVFIMGLVGCSILGCAAWQLYWEITRG